MCINLNYNILYAISLSLIKDLGVIKLKKLFNAFGSYYNIVNAPEEELIEKGKIPIKLAKSIRNVKNDLHLSEIENALKKNNVNVLLYGDEMFPETLAEIYYTPCVLYYKGKFIKQDYNAIAVVGSRVPVNYAKKCTESLVKSLVNRAITIVSGLARGIDTCAHQSAILNNGRTIAVLGSGINNIYPPENKKLADKIADNGVLLSEYPLYTKPAAKHFPWRNRIISALALATVVIQAANKSGSLITAYFALEQGKEIFALPFEVTSKYGCGCNELIKKGAHLLQNAEDIFENINFKSEYLKNSSDNEKEKSIPNIILNNEETGLLEFLQDNKHIEDIAKFLNKNISEISIILLKLEMNDLIKKFPGNFYKAV